MKTFITIRICGFLSCLSLWLGPSAASAQEAERALSFYDPMDQDRKLQSPKQIRVKTEFFEMDAKSALSLLDDERFAAKDADLRQEILRRLKEGGVTLLETGVIAARPGETAATESVRERIYPTQYEPPEVTPKVNIPEGVDVDKLREVLTTPPLPASFETRNVGLILQVEPTLGDNDNVIDLRYSPELTYYVGDTSFMEWRDRRGKADVVMPKFYTMRINTSLTCLNKVPFMVSVMSPKDDEGVTDPTRKVFVFVTCTIRFVGDR